MQFYNVVKKAVVRAVPALCPYLVEEQAAPNQAAHRRRQEAVVPELRELVFWCVQRRFPSLSVLNCYVFFSFVLHLALPHFLHLFRQPQARLPHHQYRLLPFGSACGILESALQPGGVLVWHICCEVGTKAVQVFY